MKKPTDEQIAKLPAWARGYIAELSRQREAAIRSLNEFLDQQKETDVWIEDNVCLGETTGPASKRRYLDTNAVVFRVDGEEYEVAFSKYSNTARCRGHSLIVYGGRYVTFAPISSNCIEIFDVPEERLP